MIDTENMTFEEARLALVDDMNNFVDIIACDDKTFQDMSTLLCFLQLVLGTADCYVMTVLHKVLDAFLEGKQTRTSFDKSDTEPAQY